METNLYEHDPLVTGAKGLVFIGDKVLVYQRDGNGEHDFEIDLPGGGVEINKGETPFEGFSRELLEEFGLTITTKDVVHSRRYNNGVSDDRFAEFLVVALPAERVTDIRFGDEGIGYTLLLPEEHLALPNAWKLLQTRAHECLRASECMALGDRSLQACLEPSGQALSATSPAGRLT